MDKAPTTYNTAIVAGPKAEQIEDAWRSCNTPLYEDPQIDPYGVVLYTEDPNNPYTANPVEVKPADYTVIEQKGDDGDSYELYQIKGEAFTPGSIAVQALVFYRPDTGKGTITYLNKSTPQ